MSWDFIADCAMIVAGVALVVMIGILLFGNPHSHPGETSVYVQCLPVGKTIICTPHTINKDAP